MEDAGCYVGQYAVLDGDALAVGDVDEGHGVERVGRVGCAVGVEGIVGVAVVGDNDGLVAGGLGCFDDFAHALVDGLHSLFDGFVDTRVAHHVAVGEVDHDEVELVLPDGFHELVLHLVGAHLGLEVVGGDFGAGHEDAFLALVGGFATAVEEEGDVCVLLRLGRVELLEALLTEVFAQGVLDVLLGEEDVEACERGVVGRHAVVLQAGDGVHSLLGHVLLCEDDGELLGAVVAVVEEDDDVALLDGAVDERVVDGLDELVGDAFVVAFLHGLEEVFGLFAFGADEQVVGYLDAFPAFVAVHGVEAAYDAGDVGIAGFLTFLQHLSDEALAALGVGVAAVHEAVHEGVLHAVLLADFDEFEEVVERGVYAAVGGEAHEVDVLACGLGVLVGADDFGVAEDAAVLTGAVDFHKVLIDDAAGADVEVTHLRVAHLSVGQADVLAAGQQLAVGISGINLVEVGSRSVVDDVALAVVAYAPAVKDHQECFLCHNVIYCF